ncbi:MAG: HAD-IIIA family hydrolase [Pirellulaceae bacterium]|nr:HAD-IIIA family hydrolase [Pirellulaceae bacterium]
MPALLRSDSDIAHPIRCIITDVDGVMTDGRIIYDSTGVETKCFHVRDGLAIKLWMQSGFQFGILTSRNSKMVAKRAKELGIEHLAQGHAEKAPAAQSMLDSFGCSSDELCYIGDDLPDIPVMKSAGLAVAPADASVDTRETAHWVLHSKGGEGALREVVERLLRAKHRWEEHLPG